METPFQPVGIDVSKDTLDLALLTASRPLSRRGANDPQAFASLLAWMRQHATGPLHVCLEATGTYHDALVSFLLSQDVRVSVLPSNRLKAFRESEGLRSKTDKLDAILLATYCRQKQPDPFVPVPEELAALREQLRRLSQLEAMRQQERNRLGNGRLGAQSRAQIHEHIQLLSSWIKAQLTQIRAWFKQEDNEAFAKAVRLLRSIPGIGERSSWHLVAVLGEDARRFPDARHLVLYAGVDVVRRDSGQRRAGQISKRGPAKLRACLGMAAIVAKRWDAHMGQWAEQLSARGKKSRQVRVAIMRKLLHLAYGVLTSQQAYNPRRAWPTHAQEEDLAT